MSHSSEYPYVFNALKRKDSIRTFIPKSIAELREIENFLKKQTLRISQKPLQHERHEQLLKSTERVLNVIDLALKETGAHRFRSTYQINKWLNTPGRKDFNGVSPLYYILCQEPEHSFLNLHFIWKEIGVDTSDVLKQIDLHKRRRKR